MNVLADVVAFASHGVMPGSAGTVDWAGVEPLARGPAIRAGVGAAAVSTAGVFAETGLGPAWRHARRRVQHLILRGPTTPPASFTVATPVDRQWPTGNFLAPCRHDTPSASKTPLRQRECEESRAKPGARISSNAMLVSADRTPAIICEGDTDG